MQRIWARALNTKHSSSLFLNAALCNNCLQVLSYPKDKCIDWMPTYVMVLAGLTLPIFAKAKTCGLGGSHFIWVDIFTYLVLEFSPVELTSIFLKNQINQTRKPVIQAELKTGERKIQGTSYKAVQPAALDPSSVESQDWVCVWKDTLFRKL